MAVGEVGDKTQLITTTITLAANDAAHPVTIWAGETLAIIPVSLANASFFSYFSGRFDLRTAHFVGATLFAFFAVDTAVGIATGPGGVRTRHCLEAVVATAAGLVFAAA